MIPGVLMISLGISYTFFGFLILLKPSIVQDAGIPIIIIGLVFLAAAYLD